MNSNTNDNTIDIATIMLQSNTTTTTIDWSDHTSESSIFDSSYTYSNDKYSCVKEFYHIHLVFNYLIFVSGLVCLVSRLIPASNKYHIHAWSGRIYILSMLWSTSASLLINNEGLPVAVLVSFVAVMGGLTIGWIVIIVHKQMINNQATVIVQKKLIENMKRDGDEDGTNDTTTTDLNLNDMMNDATMEIVKSKTFVQRFFSLKSMHGILFFVSWMQIAGRIFNSGDGEFSCRSYPVYKPIEAPHIPDEAFVEGYDQNRLKLMNVHDPNWEALPWSGGPVQWSLLIILASAVMAIIVHNFEKTLKQHKKTQTQRHKNFKKTISRAINQNMIFNMNDNTSDIATMAIIGGILFSLFFTWLASSSKTNTEVTSPVEGTKPMIEEQNQEEDEEVELTMGNNNNNNINYDSTNASDDASLNNTEDDNITALSSSSSSLSLSSS
eukprot:CAMPEP_0170849132 /NCGR_PEP_ID=MMETSP0734-20130129/9808_1 /TAXON_ID=186038 /ORGANISM="Fragilariopsis kerguelensis, Strain L26-C5" /LENGTH=438 /DNA_ID=CAMNT_0011218707 /DNA_START=62 /DNA_END=1378 /DNA_ORIENTATION=-